MQICPTTSLLHATNENIHFVNNNMCKKESIAEVIKVFSTRVLEDIGENNIITKLT